MDECWLDVTDSPKEAMIIAEEIRQAAKDELGLTVSIGVSFNKIFAKLGSDMKKPDAITQITVEDFKEKVWPLPCSDLLYCGRATTAKLSHIGVRTIGDLAKLPPDLLQRKFGKNGVQLWRYANGLDTSRVAHQDYTAPAKSVGHGITCKADVENEDEAHKVIVSLSQDIGYKLRLMNQRAKGVALYVRDNQLLGYGWQAVLPVATQDEATIANMAYRLLQDKYPWRYHIRQLTVSAINLECTDVPTQTSMFYDYEGHERKSRLNHTIDEIRNKFGKSSIFPALILDESRMPRHADRDIIMPGYMYQ